MVGSFSVLGGALAAALSDHWPQRQIIVVSDGSTDDTLEVLARYRRFVDVVAVPAGGKALALNAGVAEARGEIVVFADARQVFAADALRELAAPFADPQVGAVTGELSYTIPDRRLNTDGDNGGTVPSWTGGLSLQYSLPYLQSQVQDFGLPEFFNRLIPLAGPPRPVLATHGAAARCSAEVSTLVGREDPSG